MDLLLAIIAVILAYWLIVTLNWSLWTILIVLAIVALAVYIYRNGRPRRF